MLSWLKLLINLLLYLVGCLYYWIICRLRLKCEGTRAETKFGLSAKRMSPFKSAGASVQSTTGSRGVRISGSNGSNAGYTMFRGRMQDYWLPTLFASFPFTSPTVRHRVPSGFNWALHRQNMLSAHFYVYVSVAIATIMRVPSQEYWFNTVTNCPCSCQGTLMINFKIPLTHGYGTN